MPPRRGAAGGRGGQTGRSGVRVDVGLEFAFRPSIGISARGIDKLGLDIRSFREPLRRSIQQVIAPSFQKNFEVGGRPKWEPLSDFAVEVRGSATPILVRSGLLKRTAGQLNIWTIDQTKAALLDLPPKIWYGKLHQTGVSGRGRKGSQPPLPARPWAVIQPGDYAKIDKVFEDWFAERMERSGAFKRGGR